MKELLMINSSPNGSGSAGFRLAMDMIESLRSRRPELNLTVRDLMADPLLPVSDAYCEALLGGRENDDPAFAQSERLIVELERSDVLFIATPIHNFTVPAALKLWVDNVVRARRTFGRGPNGKIGLLADRPTYLLISSGGIHRGPQANQPEFISSFLRCVLNTIGLHDLRFVYLQGMATGPGAVSAALLQARRQLSAEPVFFPLEETAHG
ncbi:NAD(P)H-dependent oxidoreductase [Pseudomonas sp. REP124]|uniref:FMN-dependent NADH-azoreductase n=1 Tax=Pseudomonas sp. REP124 TaxID=2875731 RepID=UPI001CCC8A28|nr:NAD(P)H-dependent oxidoreductase [Pseudomonas sp. REP124]MBZ9781905.1 NAD(P)H-dependent oxidoreductase [Pseudomonas sp. REP124]